MPRPRWKNPDKRMARAVELRQQGWSLRRIGTELAVSAQTIQRDLLRWEKRPEADTKPGLRLVPTAFHEPVPSDADGTGHWNTYGTEEAG